MQRDLILRIGAKLILPFILIFAFYVHFHGDYGPGGGFQGGVIAAGVIILYAIVFGLAAAKRVAPPAVVEKMLPLGVLIYCSTGLPALFQDHRYLDFSVLSHHGVHGHEYGIISVEIGVLMTVASTMIAIFYAFAERGRT